MRVFINYSIIRIHALLGYAISLTDSIDSHVLLSTRLSFYTFWNLLQI